MDFFSVKKCLMFEWKYVLSDKEMKEADVIVVSSYQEDLLTEFNNKESLLASFINVKGDNIKMYKQSLCKLFLLFHFLSK